MSRTPTPYTRQANFTSFEASNPSKPKPGASLDAEFNAVRAALDATQSRLAEIQRDDGALMNASVGNDQFKDEVDFGFNSIGDWETNKEYAARDGVWHDSIFYRCLIAHRSGVFAADLAAGLWKELVDFKSHEDAAAASAQAAADSAVSAGASATSASASATAAGVSAGTASASAIAAADSADAAAASAAAAGAAAIAEVIAVFGYLPPVAFASGLDVDSSRFTVTYDGVTYAPVADAIPFTTTGTFNPAQWRLIQGVAAADLSAPGGSDLIGYGSGSLSDALHKRIVRAATVTSMKSNPDLSIGDEVRVAGHFSAGDGGAAHYEVVSAGTGVDDGGSFINLPGSGLQAKLIPSSLSVSVEQFGAISVYNPDAPWESNSFAAGNTTAFKNAIAYAKKNKIGTVTAYGRGYAVNDFIVPGGVCVEGGPTFLEDGAAQAKSPCTVLYQPQAYTSAPLAQIYEDGNTADGKWGAGLRRFTLRRDGPLNSGTLLFCMPGARATLDTLDLIGGGDGLVVDGLQDSNFTRIRRSNGGNGVRLVSTRPGSLANALHFYDLWIESCIGRSLEIAGKSATTLANSIEIFGLKLEGRPTSANELVYIKNALGVQIYGIVLPGATAATPSAEWSLFRIEGRALGIIADVVSGNNNYAGDMKSLVALGITGADSSGIHIRMHGTVAGSGTVGSIVHYGDAASGHVMPRQSHIDCSGLSIAPGVLGTPAASSGLALTYSNTLALQSAEYGARPHYPHPMSTSGTVGRWVSPNGSIAFEQRVSNSLMAIYSGENEACYVGSSGEMRIREPEFNFPVKLRPGSMSQRTKQQLVDNSPNASSFPGGQVLVSDATVKQLAYSDGTNWRWVKTLQIVSTSNDPSPS